MNNKIGSELPSAKMGWVEKLTVLSVSTVIGGIAILLVLLLLIVWAFNLGWLGSS